MKKVFTMVLAFSASLTSSFACPVCKAQQPKLLRGILHGAGPDSNWDYLIVGVMVAVVVGTLLMSARYLVRPGEINQDHVKYSIINDKEYGN